MSVLKHRLLGTATKRMIKTGEMPSQLKMELENGLGRRVLVMKSASQLVQLGIRLVLSGWISGVCEGGLQHGSSGFPGFKSRSDGAKFWVLVPMLAGPAWWWLEPQPSLRALYGQCHWDPARLSPDAAGCVLR